MCVDTHTYDLMIYYKKLCHVVIETEKSHDLPPASWRPREACGVVLETGGVIPSPGQESEVMPPFSVFLLYSGPQQVG